MKFTVENEPFAKALSLVKSCVPARSTIPILSHIAVEAKAGGTASLRATNMERETEVTIAAEIDAPGKIALPGEVLSTLTRRLTKGGQSQLELDGHRCRIRSGTAKWELNTLPLEDYPVAKEVGADAVRFPMPASELADLLRLTLYAVDTNRARYYLCGVHLHVGDRKLVAVATDGLRLARKLADIPKGAATLPPIIVPTDAAKHMLALLETSSGEVEIAVSERLLEIKVDGARFATALVEGSFPDYKRVIPKPNGNAATVRPYALVEAIERATAVYAGEMLGTPVVTITSGSGGLSLLSGTRGSHEASETCDAEVVGKGIDVTLDATFLAEALRAWPESVSVEMHHEGGGAPVLFISPERLDSTQVLMPRKR